MAARVLAWRGDTADQGSGTAWGGAHLVPARRRCPCRRAAQAHHPRPQNGRVRLPQRRARARPERARGPCCTRRRRSSRRIRGRPRSAPATASSRPRGPPRPLRPARRPPGRAPRLRRVSTARRPQASSRGLCLAAGPLAQEAPWACRHQPLPQPHALPQGKIAHRLCIRCRGAGIWSARCAVAQGSISRQQVVSTMHAERSVNCYAAAKVQSACTDPNAARDLRALSPDRW